jgi:hypothetical protein
MTTSESVSYLTCEFDDFLFAQIGTNSGKTPLSVLSVLARQGLDPWDEAAGLAELPRASAAKRLVAMIAAIPGASSAYLDAGTVSDRLITLLPSPTGLKVPPRPKLGLSRSALVLWAILVAIILIIQLAVING